MVLSFAARKAFCMVAFSRDTLSARCLEVCLDLMIKCSGTKCPYLPKQCGRLLRPSCLFWWGAEKVPEAQKPAWPWVAGSFFLWNRRVKAWCSDFRKNCWACRGYDDEFFKVAFLTGNVATSLKVSVFHHFLFIMRLWGEAAIFYCSLNWDCCICFSFVREQDLAKVEKLCKMEFALSLNSKAH